MARKRVMQIYIPPIRSKSRKGQTAKFGIKETKNGKYYVMETHSKIIIKGFADKDKAQAYCDDLNNSTKEGNNGM